VMIAEAEERHLHTLLVKARTHGHAKHPAVEFLRTFKVGDF